VLVVEAPERSGALITARYAMEMGREVMALPGRVDQENASGCHRLLRDGAALIRDLDDVLEALGPAALPEPEAEDAHAASPPPDIRAAHAPTGEPASAGEESGALFEPPAPSPSPEARREAAILAALSDEPTHIDQICVATGLPVHEVSSALMILELKRRVRQQPGKLFLRAETPGSS
jgi:DNA processing protein